jgi:hypothetical protein
MSGTTNQSTHRNPTQDDLNAVARRLNMIAMSLRILRALAERHHHATDFNARAIGQAAAQMHSVKLAMGATR